jgi:hypothetical protein
LGSSEKMLIFKAAIKTSISDADKY